MSRSRKIRCPIHGFIEVKGRECDLLDTSLIQRLRYINQLAMAYLVYPGAVHTRFDHALGVFHVAGRMCEVLEIGDSSKRLIRYAALLHDIGHGPFSHVSEAIFAELTQKNGTENCGRKVSIHEKIGQQLILKHADLNGPLAQNDREEIATLLADGFGDRINHDIISGPLDADKQDYLLRDSYFCGVRYGVYDIAQLHQTLCRDSNRTETVLMVEDDGIHALEQFVLAKYYLTTQVYRHKVRLITDHMLIRAIKLGVDEDHVGFLEELYTYCDDDGFRTNYLSWNDGRVISELLKPEHEEKYVGRMFRRLLKRQLLKRVFTKKLKELPETVRIKLPERFTEQRDSLEREIAVALADIFKTDMDPHYVILTLFNIDSVRTQTKESEAAITIKKKPIPVPFDEESALFRSIDSSSKDEFLECYAPVTYPNDRERDRLLQSVEESVKHILDRFFSSAATAQEEQKGGSNHVES
jgi:uncharacterized protein